MVKKQKGGITEKHKEIIGIVRYIHYIVFIFQMYTYANTLNRTPYTCAVYCI